MVGNVLHRNGIRDIVRNEALGDLNVALGHAVLLDIVDGVQHETDGFSKGIRVFEAVHVVGICVLLVEQLAHVCVAVVEESEKDVSELLVQITERLELVLAGGYRALQVRLDFMFEHPFLTARDQRPPPFGALRQVCPRSRSNILSGSQVDPCAVADVLIDVHVHLLDFVSHVFIGDPVADVACQRFISQLGAELLIKRLILPDGNSHVL